MFAELEKINERPEPFEFYTAEDLWTDAHTSAQMLSYHLDGAVDLSSRNKEFIRKSINWITTEFNIKDGCRVVDFGCGPGLYTLPMAECGAEVTGIDFSPRSISYARDAAADRGLNIHYENQNYLEFDSSEPFDLITMIMCDFCALSPAQRADLLKIFQSILAPEGSILLDVYSMSAFNNGKESAGYELNQLNGFWSPEKYYGFVNTFKYDEACVVLDKYTIVQADRTRSVFNWLQYFTPETLEKEFSRAGLVVKKTLADVAGTPYDPRADEFAVIAGRA